MHFLKYSVTILALVLCNNLLLNISYANTTKSSEIKKSEPATIIVLGDSISAAYGININQGWVAQLQAKLTSLKPNYRVLNASISGDTTRTGLNRLKPLLITHQPDIVIVALGGNDGLRGLTLKEIEFSLTKIILLSQKYHSKVLLLGLRLPPNYGKAYNEKFNKVYQSIAGKFDIPLVVNFLANVDDNSELMQSDQIHPKAEAQPQILNNIWATLKTLIK